MGENERPRLYQSSKEEFADWVWEYNNTILRRPALEERGTSRWEAAVVAEARREVAKLGTHINNRVPSLRLKAVRRDRDSLSPQRCVACERKVEAGEVWAHTTMPEILCPKCADSARRSVTAKFMENFELAKVSR